MESESAEGSGEDGRRKLMPEEMEADVGVCEVGAEGVHVDKNFLPLVIVSCGGVAGVFAAGTGDGVCAGTAVAYGTCLTVGANLVSCRGENFIVIHFISPFYIEIIYFLYFNYLLFLFVCQHRSFDKKIN